MTIPSIHATPSFMIMLTGAFAYERDLRTRPGSGDVLREADGGQALPGGRVRAGQRLRSQIREDTARALQSVDVLITPTTLDGAPFRSCSIDFPFARATGPVQRHRPAHPRAADRLLHHRPAAVVPDLGPALRRGHRAARGPRLSAGDRLASPPPAGARMTPTAALDDLKAHVGRRESANDTVTAAPANLLRLTFGRAEPELRPGDPLPPGWQALYFLPRFPPAALRPDGSPLDTGVIPPCRCPPHVRGRRFLPPPAAHRRDDSQETG
jgi:hypothetical protein